ncbi:LysR family transcriptional regulator [Rhizobium ruizarguesonis]|uniref:LysR family transcriptional regulator n=1 Tax=Rhizobium ruizarguesonis TaxID=2081791 RepID=UPI0004754FD4|nr:LysR family transcriptional regulator [Rhizobium ruizarguesonis]MBY5834194.1 LysR family transcriptional regulator [Rhizobium leguminosarum]QND23647.1 LysR family transcriptional regulator [Rhizobium leguminosarum bv. viciae]MBY5847781.1 LysR family transcriptional regulator [Rhizobium leguminosarum]MBY5855831.1 LysR family transcriptional regulator [Rhizobium leguminosarum]MBY5862436.1 LysR family transcriptional regulator [Rhizobium leguminosarum]
MDRFQELEAFIAVVDAGGFSAAARRTGKSQPAVSKAIGALEYRLGVALFNRSTRRVTLTDQGQRYFDRMKPLLEEIEAASRELVGSTLDMSGSIRVAAATTFGRLHILPLIPDLLATFPGLEMDLILSDAMRDMVEDRIDLAIRVGRVDEPDAVVRRVAGTPLVCVGSKSYFEKHGIPETPAELVNHNCLLYGGLRESANWPFVGPKGPFSVAVRGNLSSNSVETIRAGVLAGVGIGLFAKVSLVEELSHPDVITVLDDYVRDVRDVSFIWPKRRFVSVRVRRVTDFLAASLQTRL